MFTSLWTSHGVVLRTLCLKPTRINFQIHERFFRMLFNQKHPLQISARVSGFPKKHLEKSTLLEAPLAVESSHKALILWEKPIPLAVKKALAFFGNGFSCMKKAFGNGSSKPSTVSITHWKKISHPTSYQGTISHHVEAREEYPQILRWIQAPMDGQMCRPFTGGPCTRTTCI